MRGWKITPLQKKRIDMPSYDSILITGYDGLTDLEQESLQDQNVCLDDWDLLLFFKSDSTVLSEDHTLIDWQIQKILDNLMDDVTVLTNISFRDCTWYLGIRYH